MNPANQPPDNNPPPGRTPNYTDHTRLDEVRGFTLNDLPAGADPFLEPLDEPLPGDTRVYVVWRGRVPGLYYRWENASAQVLSFSNSQFRRFANITNARVAFYLLSPDRLRGPGVPGQGPGQRQPEREATQRGGTCQSETNRERGREHRHQHTEQREPSPHSSDEYWAASDDVDPDDFVEVDRRLANLRINNSPVDHSSTISSTSTLTLSATVDRRATSTPVRPSNSEAGPSSGVRQLAEHRVWSSEGNRKEVEGSERSWYESDGRYFVVVVGLAPGVYRHLGTARIASGLLPDTVIRTAASEDEANALFVAEYMRQRVRRLRDN